MSHEFFDDAISVIIVPLSRHKMFMRAVKRNTHTQREPVTVLYGGVFSGLLTGTESKVMQGYNLNKASRSSMEAAG